MVKKVGKYEIGKTIGEGTFGKVKLAVNTETNEKVAIKVSKPRTRARGSIYRDATVACSFRQLGACLS